MVESGQIGLLPVAAHDEAGVQFPRQSSRLVVGIAGSRLARLQQEVQPPKQRHFPLAFRYDPATDILQQSQIVTETPRPWNRRSTETTKAYAAFLAYVALGARRSVREAARQNNIKTRSSSGKNTRVKTTVSRWLGWSARHKWVSRADARDAWISCANDEQIRANVLACQLAITTRAHDFLKSTDSEVFLRGTRAFTLQFPPIQRVEDVSERFEDLSDIPDADIERMKEIRDAARAKNEQINLEE